MLAVLTQAGVEQALVAHEECFLCVCGVLAGLLEMGLLEMGLLEMSLLGWGSRFKGDIELSMVRIRLMRR